MKGGPNGTFVDRIEHLKQRQKEISALLAAEHIKRLKREKREQNKFDLQLGEAVRKTGSGSGDFRRVVMTAISAELDEKEKSFFTERGWFE